jgi:hypothetical protein
VSEPSERPRRRRRRGSPLPEAASSGQQVEDGPDAVAEYVPPATDDEAAAAQGGRAAKARAGRGSGKSRDGADRGLRELVGNTPSQLGPVGALRGRDANRPTEEDLAAAERDLSIVRRHWTPPS